MIRCGECRCGIPTTRISRAMSPTLPTWQTTPWLAAFTRRCSFAALSVKRSAGHISTPGRGAILPNLVVQRAGTRWGYERSARCFSPVIRATERQFTGKRGFSVHRPATFRELTGLLCQATRHGLEFGSYERGIAYRLDEGPYRLCPFGRT